MQSTSNLLARGSNFTNLPPLADLLLVRLVQLGGSKVKTLIFRVEQKRPVDFYVVLVRPLLRSQALEALPREKIYRASLRREN